MEKYKFNWADMEEYDDKELLGRMDAICDYANAVQAPDVEVVLAMLKIEKREGINHECI